mmetsp:Transcript_6117/g.17683  ORF Transcript_6117/g.17683 Transcript_6117/m.17683 type:complete len:209 (-) Transcript_6117:103-729(-)
MHNRTIIQFQKGMVRVVHQGGHSDHLFQVAATLTSQSWHTGGRQGQFRMIVGRLGLIQTDNRALIVAAIASTNRNATRNAQSARGMRHILMGWSFLAVHVGFFATQIPQAQLLSIRLRNAPQLVVVAIKRQQMNRIAIGRCIVQAIPNGFFASKWGLKLPNMNVFNALARQEQKSRTGLLLQLSDGSQPFEFGIRMAVDLYAIQNILE